MGKISLNSMKNKKILFLTRGTTTPSSRHRVFNYVPYLKEEGFEVKVIPFPKNCLRMFYLMFWVLWADVTVVQKKTMHVWEIYFLRLLTSNFIYDLDDLATERPKKIGDEKRNVSIEKRFWLMLKMAKGVVVGNVFLQEYISAKYKKAMVVIPTPINTALYLPKKNYSTKTVTIGWIGLAGNLLYFDIMKEALTRLAAEFDIALKIICNEFIDIDGVKVIKKQWNRDSEIYDLQSCDIGIMPLNTDEWAKAKCGFKALQCMGVAIPTVVSPVGINNQIIQDGENGFLAANTDEWYEKLKKLIVDENLRMTMGQKGRNTIEDEYSFTVCSKRLKDFLENI